MLIFTHSDIRAQPSEPQPIQYGDKIFSTLNTPYNLEFETVDLYTFSGIAGDNITIRYNHQVLTSMAGIEPVAGNVVLVNLTTDEQIMGQNTLQTLGFITEQYIIPNYILPSTGEYGIVVFLAGFNENVFYSEARYDLTLTSQTSNIVTAGEITSELATGQAQVWQYRGSVGEQIRITTESDWDTTLSVIAFASQNEIAINDDDESLPNRRNSRITTTLPETGIYEIHVGAYENSVGGSYRLIIESGAENMVAPGVEIVTSNADWTPVEQDFNGIPMVLVPAGCFTMGMTYEQLEQAMIRYGTPFSGMTQETVSNIMQRYTAHQICISEAFWLDKTEVSQGVFRELGGNKNNQNDFIGANRPVETITWFEAKRFCELRGMRLPTEPEWEYAAGGPDSLVYPWGNDFDGDRITWLGNSNERTSDVGINPTNASWVGALDMSGNVSEWVSSIHYDYPYDANDGREHPTDRFEFRTMRGGSWGADFIDNFTSQIRFRAGPQAVMNHVGFRCAQTADMNAIDT